MTKPLNESIRDDLNKTFDQPLKEAAKPVAVIKIDDFLD